MTSIDELGRRAASVALDDAKRRVDVQAGLAAIRSDRTPLPSPPNHRPRRWLMLASAAAVLATIIGITALTRRDSAPIAPIESTSPATSAPSPATTSGSATVVPTVPIDTTPSSSNPTVADPAECTRETRPTPGATASTPQPFGPELAASILTCSEMEGQGEWLAVDDSSVWLAGYTDTSPVLIHLDASLRRLATIDVPAGVFEMAVDSGTVWAVGFDAGEEHLMRVDAVSGTLLSDEVLDSVVLSDATLLPASIAIAGDDVWVSTENGPSVVRRYRTDGDFVGTVPLESAPTDLAAVPGQAYALTANGDIVAIDASAGATTVLAHVPAADRGSIAAFGIDLWAATSELIHVDLASRTVSERVTASIGDLAADPHEPGRAWAAPYEPDPTMIPGNGAGVVVRLALHGVQPDGYLGFETISMNGVSRLAIMSDGTVYGENQYSAQVVRITLDDLAEPFPTLVPPADPQALIGATISTKPFEPSPDISTPPILINGTDGNLSNISAPSRAAQGASNRSRSCSMERRCRCSLVACGAGTPRPESSKSSAPP
jgi:hypothetical protein